MLTILAALALAQLKPGPLDAFRVNYSSLKVELQYEYIRGSMSAGDAARIAESGGTGFQPRPETKIIGRWACDGLAESFAFSSPDDVIAAGKAAPRKDEDGGLHPTGMMMMAALPYVPKTEGLFDGVLLAGRQENNSMMMGGGRTINVWANGEPGYLALGKSPFFWNLTHPFPQFLRVHFPGAEPKRRRTVRNGRPVEVEVYKKMQSPVDWLQTEVAYDPSVGYLPRYVRCIHFSTTITTFIGEFFLIDAKPCAAGGFVPTEWYDTDFGFEKFGTRFPDYNDETVLKPTGKAGVSHFQATSIKDRAGPVALTELDGVDSVASAGGRMTLGPGVHSLTLDAIKARMGRKISNPAPKPLPSFDYEEVRDLAPKR